MRLCCRGAALWLAVSAAALGVAPVSALGLSKDGNQPETGRQRVLRTWQESVSVDGADVVRRFEVAFDYDAGLATERTYDEAGQLLSSRTITDSQPRPSEEEIADAFGIIREDPKLGRMVSRAQARPMGGFILEEEPGQACGPRTRCLQISLWTDNGLGVLRWVVVDLTKREITYPNYGSLERERLLRRFWGDQQ